MRRLQPFLLSITCLVAVCFVTADARLRAADVDDGKERIVLLLPAGPLVMDIAITIDGEPFRRMRERMIDQMLANSDGDADGRVAWPEALANPRFVQGRFLKLAEDREKRVQHIDRYDQNSNGRVDRSEVARLLAAYAGGAVFTVETRTDLREATGPHLLSLIDHDGDGSISKTEIDLAPNRLKRRDLDNNDILTRSEIEGRLPSLGRFGTPPAISERSPPPIVHRAEDDSGWSALYTALDAYNADGATLRSASLPMFAGLAEQLDQDHNGTFDRLEAEQLKRIPPHLELDVNLGEVGELPGGVTLRSLSPELGRADGALSQQGGEIAVSLLAANLKITSSNAKPWYDYESQVRGRFARFDEDKNGYLEFSELDRLAGAGVARQFARWDLDRDQKVYPHEMSEVIEQAQRLPWSRVKVVATIVASVDFELFDANSDGRLGAREIQYAGRRLMTLDRNHDGRVSSQEIPRSITLAVDRSIYQRPIAERKPDKSATPKTTGGPAAPVNPKWFMHMDRNGDGDVSIREFLGGSEQFKRIDTNADGFIDPQEARAAG